MANSTIGKTISAVSQASTRLGPALAGPLAILIIVPLLVFGVGWFVAYSSASTARRTVGEMISEEFKEQARGAVWVLEQAINSGKAVLEAQEDWLLRNPDILASSDDYALNMRQQLRGKPALAFLGYGSEEGHYLGLFPNEARDTITFTRRERDENAGTTHLQDFDVFPRSLKLFRDQPSHTYDPRVRGWYKDTKKSGTLTTSAPYVWHDSGVTGVTISKPHFSASNEFLGAIEFDFSVNSLSQQVENITDGDDVILIHTDDKEVLAWPGLRQRALTNQEGKGSIVTADRLSDPLATAWFARFDAGDFKDVEELNVAGERFLASSARLHLPGGQRSWYVVSMGSLDAALAGAKAELARNFWIVGFAVLFATILALIFARNIVRTHVRIRRAEQKVLLAEDAVRQIGSYQLIKQLGAGGMGEVWMGRHNLLARPVAVKLILAEHFNYGTNDERDRALARFEREAKTMARLCSRHTIEIYDFGISGDGAPFYAMELLDGVDLDDLVRKEGIQPVARVISILEQAALSLAEAHDNDLVHRDIKPANIYLCRLADDLDVVKVLDFGMVRPFDADDGSGRLTMEGTIEGTPEYMAPEQIKDTSTIDGRADLYALACVGVFLLTGKDWYERDTPMAALMAHLQEPAPVLRELNPAVPEDLADIIDRCLAKEPADRPMNMRAFIEALRAVDTAALKPWGRIERERWWSNVERPSLVQTAEVLKDDGKKLVRR